VAQSGALPAADRGLERLRGFDHGALVGAARLERNSLQGFSQASLAGAIAAAVSAAGGTSTS